LIGDPFVDARLEDIHGEGATVEDRIMEGSDIEFLAELVLSVLAELEYLQLTDFVAESLSRPGDVAVGFGLD